MTHTRMMHAGGPKKIGGREELLSQQREFVARARTHTHSRTGNFSGREELSLEQRKFVALGDAPLACRGALLEAAEPVAHGGYTLLLIVTCIAFRYSSSPTRGGGGCRAQR